jgi:hypothetical protein
MFLHVPEGVARRARLGHLPVIMPTHHWKLMFAGGLAAIVACTPAPPPEIGVRVTDAAGDSGTVQFTVTVADTALSLGMRPASMAMRRDRTLVLSTPATIVVNHGAGSAMIAVVTTGATLRVTPLAAADSATGAAVGAAVRISRQGTAWTFARIPISGSRRLPTSSTARSCTATASDRLKPSAPEK